MKSIYDYQSFSAHQDFQQSLEQLETILQVRPSNHQMITEREVNTCHTSQSQNRENTRDFDLAALEDAVADIEQYLERRQGNK